MTCKSCEERRQWMKQQYDRSKERMRKVLRNLGVIDSTEQQDHRTKQSVDSDQQRTERTDS